MSELDIPVDYFPLLTWPLFFYKQQVEFTSSDKREVWFIGGNGCFGKDTKALYYDGRIKNVQDVKVGDCLMGDDSTKRNVLKTLTGTEQLYEFELKTSKTGFGEKYIFNESHILYLESSDYASPVEVTVRDYLKWNERKRRGYLFCKREVDNVKTELPIDPYIFGCWLGDGDSGAKRFSNVDQEVIAEFRKYIESIGCNFRQSDKWHYQISGKPNNGSIKNNFQISLEKLGVRYNKHIPEIYMKSDNRARLELLAGLIDTDGCYDKKRYSFYQTNRNTAYQVCELARSVGCHANVAERIRVEGKPQYVVYITRNITKIPCRIERKKAQEGDKKFDLRFGVKRITPLNVGQYYGFCLDGNHRFLSDDYTVLRNTGKTLTLYSTLALQMLGIHPRQLGPPPITVRVLVPSFDNVEKTALEKLLSSQKIAYRQLSDKQAEWVKYGEAIGAIKHHKKGKHFEIGALLPRSVLLSEKGFKKEHRGIELSNGSKIWWVTTEQGWMSMRGAEQDIEAVDEESGWDEFNQVKRGLRNAKGGGRIYGALTPPYKEGQGPTWTKEKVVDAALEDDKIHVINACMDDNPAISKEYIEWWKKGKTQKQIDVEVYGKYPTWGDLVHPDFQDRLWDPGTKDGHLIRNDVELPGRNDVDWVMAFDWHQSKPCAAVFGYITRDGNLTIFDELDKDLADGKQINELADLFRQIEGEPHSRRRFRRWQDPSAKHNYNAVERGFNAWEAFRKAGIVTSVGKNRDPEVGISIVNQYFRGNGKDHPRLFIYERCKYTRQYLNNHYWKRGEDGKGKPDPRWSDYPISIRYLCQEFGQSHMREKRSKWPVTSYGDLKPKPIQIDVSRWA